MCTTNLFGWFQAYSGYSHAYKGRITMELDPSLSPPVSIHLPSLACLPDSQAPPFWTYLCCYPSNRENMEGLSSQLTNQNILLQEQDRCKQGRLPSYGPGERTALLHSKAHALHAEGPRFKPWSPQLELPEATVDQCRQYWARCISGLTQENGVLLSRLGKCDFPIS